MADTLTNRQLLAINHIIASSTLEDARRKIRLSKGTLYTWLKDDGFKTELKRQRDDLVKEASNHLKGAMTKAVKGLIDLMDTPRPDLKRWVYKDIIEYTLKSIEIENLEDRLEKVEHAISERKSYR